MQDRAERKLIENAMKAPYLALEEEQDLAKQVMCMFAFVGSFVPFAIGPLCIEIVSTSSA